MGIVHPLLQPLPTSHLSGFPEITSRAHRIKAQFPLAGCPEDIIIGFGERRRQKRKEKDQRAIWGKSKTVT